MNKKLLTIGFLASIVALSSCGRVPHTGEAEMKNQLDTLSYALGFYEAQSYKQKFEQVPFDTIDYKSIARAFKDAKIVENYIDFRKDQFDTIDVEMFKKGFFNELAYGKSYFTKMTADIYIRKKFEEVHERRNSENNVSGEENLKEGQAFLEENAKKEDVETLESGLQYKIIDQGNGPKPKLSDVVKCTYHGTLIDGTVFDSSLQQGDTATLRVNGVIKGWQEALQMMPTGSKWELYIPGHLAYGTQGAGDNIGPNETIIFEIELIDIVNNDK
jgi:FKBP-type peptidyl-prolyl cis-trans isomerase